MKTCHFGVDLGGTTVSIAAGDEAGGILARDQMPTDAHQGPQGVLDRIADRVLKLTSDHSLAPAGLGMGVPGLVDVAAGVTRFLPNLATQWRDVPAAALLSEKLGCPVRLLNDVRTATLGELTFGHGKTVDTLAFFSIGTGIGGGVVIDGKLRLGPLGAAGELGHQTVVADGPLCGCGNRGCLEAVASGSALIAEGVRLLKCGMAPRLFELTDGNLSRVSPQLMAQAAAAGDEAVQVVLDRAAEYLGIAAANVVAILHPPLIVLGGGVAEMGEVLTSRVKSVIDGRVGMFPTDEVRVEQSLLGADAGVMGALALASRDVGQG